MHYVNGRLAQVGDAVVGHTYNRKGIQVGLLVSVPPSNLACNAVVAILERRPVVEKEGMVFARAAILVRAGDGGHSGELGAVFCDYDYTECGKLLHAEDVVKDGALLEQLSKGYPLQEGTPGPLEGKDQPA